MQTISEHVKTHTINTEHVYVYIYPTGSMHGIFTYTCNQDHLNVVSVWVSHRGEGPFGPNPSEVKVLGTVDGKDKGGKTPESGKQNTGNLVFVGEIRVFLYRCKQMRIKLPWMFFKLDVSVSILTPWRLAILRTRTLQYRFTGFSRPFVCWQILRESTPSPRITVTTKIMKHF